MEIRPGKRAYLVGIKGTGMAALAEILKARGITVSGSDVEEEFYTDQVLQREGIPYFKGFNPAQVPENLDFGVCSAAYGEDHPEVARLKERRVPLYLYPEVLGFLSQGTVGVAVAGVHGKTTTTALCGTLIQALKLEGSVLAGSVVPRFGDKSTLIQGEEFFLAETCEYRRHFLHFSPDKMIVTSVEADHLDYFKDRHDVEKAFCQFIQRLPPGGLLVYCEDDEGTREVVRWVGEERSDLILQPYGFTASGSGRVEKLKGPPGENHFSLAALEGRVFRLQVPGDHTILDAAAALLMVMALTPPEKRKNEEALAQGLWNFTGSRRRTEIVGEKGGILIMDDYGHHPSAIATTLRGLKEFYPQRRLVVDFMSHTYSRTAGLLEEFATSFGAADEVILHKIYPSAREEYRGNIQGEDLYEKTKLYHPRVRYFKEPEEALPYLRESLGKGDLFLTLGAGDNWQLGRKLYVSLGGG